MTDTNISNFAETQLRTRIAQLESEVQDLQNEAVRLEEEKILCIRMAMILGHEWEREHEELIALREEVQCKTDPESSPC